MKPETWKTIAIIFMIFFILENILLTWGYMELVKEEKNTNLCLYDFCGDYPEATYEAGVCTCYDFDLIGSYVVADSTYYD